MLVLLFFPHYNLSGHVSLCLFIIGQLVFFTFFVSGILIFLTYHVFSLILFITFYFFLRNKPVVRVHLRGLTDDLLSLSEQSSYNPFTPDQYVGSPTQPKLPVAHNLNAIDRLGSGNSKLRHSKSHSSGGRVSFKPPVILKKLTSSKHKNSEKTADDAIASDWQKARKLVADVNTMQEDMGREEAYGSTARAMSPRSKMVQQSHVSFSAPNSYRSPQAAHQTSQTLSNCLSPRDDHPPDFTADAADASSPHLGRYYTESHTSEYHELNKHLHRVDKSSPSLEGNLLHENKFEKSLAYFKKHKRLSDQLSHGFNNMIKKDADEPVDTSVRVDSNDFVADKQLTSMKEKVKFLENFRPLSAIRHLSLHDKTKGCDKFHSHSDPSSPSRIKTKGPTFYLTDDGKRSSLHADQDPDIDATSLIERYADAMEPSILLDVHGGKGVPVTDDTNSCTNPDAALSPVFWRLPLPSTDNIPSLQLHSAPVSPTHIPHVSLLSSQHLPLRTSLSLHPSPIHSSHALYSASLMEDSSAHEAAVSLDIPSQRRPTSPASRHLPQQVWHF